MFQVATAGWGLIAVSTTKSDGACGIAAHPCTKRKDGAASMEVVQAKIAKGGPPVRLYVT